MGQLGSVPLWLGLCWFKLSFSTVVMCPLQGRICPLGEGLCKQWSCGISLVMDETKQDHRLLSVLLQDGSSEEQSHREEDGDFC